MLKRTSIVGGLLVALCLAGCIGSKDCKFEKLALNPFQGYVLTTDLENPWNIVWGPDDYLWVSERSGKRITRINPETGEKKLVGTIDEAYPDPKTPHEGVLGFALSPDMLKGGDDYIYVFYTHRVNGQRLARIARYTYNLKTQTMGDPQIIIDGIPAGSDHNGGRLIFGPDKKLYLSKGEMGHNQFLNACLPIEAQRLPTTVEVAKKDWTAYVGKVLRLNPDGSIPADNPVLSGVRSHVFTYGHRNPQGLAFGPTGLLYSSEQGPSSDDELNLLESGGNYGWPHVAGFRDDHGYVYANYSAAADCKNLKWDANVIPAGVPQQKETSWNAPNFKEPLKTFYTVPMGFNFSDARNAGDGLDYVCWPTVGASSVLYYPEKGVVPFWRNSLMMTSLKNGSVYVAKLGQSGKQLQGDVGRFFRSENRYRSLAIDPEGRRLFVITDNGGSGRDDALVPTTVMKNPGSILVFRYVGDL
ncbi:MAG: PQQ-dependent sugar dehydrogenase [Victivallales bacterium]|jgi:PQQ-dependent dehydrogenase (s-GDH family)|nr:PQQ-dependent sugar dehydrogenase [Victivallales bacterium]